jgi:hypothetical protein
MMMSGFHKPVNWQTRAANARGKRARQMRQGGASFLL